jgi:hypothetical protein
VLPLTAITKHEGGEGEAETATPPARHLADQGIYVDIVSRPEDQTLAASDLVADSNQLPVPGSPRRIQSAHIVQQADSLSEQIVYRTMWDAGKAETSYDDGQPTMRRSFPSFPILENSMLPIPTPFYSHR